MHWRQAIYSLECISTHLILHQTGTFVSLSCVPSSVLFPRGLILPGRMQLVLPVSPVPTGSSATSFTKTPVPSNCPACCFLSTWQRNQCSVSVLSKKLFLVHTHTQAHTHAGSHKDSHSCSYINTRANSRSRASCLIGLESESKVEAAEPRG